MSDRSTPCTDAVDSITAGADPDLLEIMLWSLAYYGDLAEHVTTKQVMAEAFEHVAAQVNARHKAGVVA